MFLSDKVEMLDFLYQLLFVSPPQDIQYESWSSIGTYQCYTDYNILQIL